MILTLGDLTLDIQVRPEGPIAPGSDVKGDIRLSGGGSAANFASWTAYQGIEVAFIAGVGLDWSGDVLCQELERQGVQLLAKQIPEVPTGSILLFVDAGGERHMITQRGANLTLTPGDLNPSLFQQARHLHLTAYSFFDGAVMVETAQQALTLAHQHDLSISLDPSSYALLENFGVERFLELTAGSHFIFPNLKEGQILTGQRGGEAILRDLARNFLVPVLKLGSGGVLYLEEEGVKRVEAVKTPYFQDSIGAGDAFAAGFLASYLQNQELLTACQKGVSLAHLAVTQAGGRPPR